jgi:hypothetical protein
MTPEEALKAYEQGPSDVEGYISDAVNKAYGNLEKELQTVRHYETQQLPKFYETFVGGPSGGYGIGYGAADISPAAKMQMAADEVGRQATLGRTARDVLAQRKASIEDLVGRGVGIWQTGYGMKQNAYDRWWQQQQAAQQQKNWEAQMALERERMNRASSGYGSLPGNLFEALGITSSATSAATGRPGDLVVNPTTGKVVGGIGEKTSTIYNRPSSSSSSSRSGVGSAGQPVSYWKP